MARVVRRFRLVGRHRARCTRLLVKGRTVDEARRRIREALELFVDNARRAPIVDDVKLPSAATKAIRAYATLRKRPTKKTGGQPAPLDAPSAYCEPEDCR